MTTRSPWIELTIEAQVATLCLNRPEKRNAFDAQMIATLKHDFDYLKTQQDLRCVVLTHQGEHFCAGGDIAWMQAMGTQSQADNQRDAMALAEMLKALYDLPMPTIARVKGLAYGGGVGLLAACTMVIAAEQTSFCFSEVKLGLAPATIAPYVLAAMGPRQALPYFINARPFTAAEAAKMGLCHVVVPETDLIATTQTHINEILKQGPQAVRACLSLVKTLHHAPVTPTMIEATAALIAKLRVSDEGQEGLQAFLEKRTPHWVPHA